MIKKLLILLFRGKLKHVLHGTSSIIDEDLDPCTYTEYITYLLYEHWLWGRRCKIKQYRSGLDMFYPMNPKSHVMYHRVVIPWLAGISMNEIDKEVNK